MGPFACLPKENEASHIKRVFIIFLAAFFLHDTLYCTKYYKGHLDVDEWTNNQLDSASFQRGWFFPIEHFKILDRKWAINFETKSFANHAVNKKVNEHSGLFHEYLVKIHKKGAALRLLICCLRFLVCNFDLHRKTWFVVQFQHLAKNLELGPGALLYWRMLVMFVHQMTDL